MTETEVFIAMKIQVAVFCVMIPCSNLVQYIVTFQRTMMPLSSV
jgi:hypothetical protein